MNIKDFFSFYSPFKSIQHLNQHISSWLSVRALIESNYDITLYHCLFFNSQFFERILYEFKSVLDLSGKKIDIGELKINRYLSFSLYF